MWYGLVFCLGVLVGILIGYARIAVFGWEPLRLRWKKRGKTYTAGEDLRPGLVYFGHDGRVYQSEHPDLMALRRAVRDAAARTEHGERFDA